MLLIDVGRLDEAEATLKKAWAKLAHNRTEFRPDVVRVMSTLGDVYRLQGHEKEAANMVKAVKKLIPQLFLKDHPHYTHYMGKVE
jgi:predicted Zn-dependent protease